MKITERFVNILRIYVFAVVAAVVFQGVAVTILAVVDAVAVTNMALLSKSLSKLYCCAFQFCHTCAHFAPGELPSVQEFLASLGKSRQVG